MPGVPNAAAKLLRASWLGAAAVPWPQVVLFHSSVSAALPGVSEEACSRQVKQLAELECAVQQTWQTSCNVDIGSVAAGCFPMSSAVHQLLLFCYGFAHGRSPCTDIFILTAAHAAHAGVKIQGHFLKQGLW